ncbi:MAG: 2-dehydropantoate 2-reductase [Candidatus Thorarchaeota archaeon]|nr:2-dehydropantoate 2-reductase [Candidatus Thorarchaeota archaeon]
MKIVVMGSGAIGSLYGGFLSLSESNSVTLVGRNPVVEAIRARGLIIKGVMGNHTITIDAVTDPSSIDSADLVLITTKTYDTVRAAKSIKHLVDKGAYVMPIQNGIGTETLVADVLDTTRVLRATTCMGAIIHPPGVITATGIGITEIGSKYSENLPMVSKVADMLQDAGFNVRASDNIQGVVWTKTIVNCGINPVGALTDMSNGEIHNNIALRYLVVRLVEETAAVADALGVELTTDDPIRYALGTAKATSENINSMLQDIRARKKTEIDSITGAVIRFAEELGIETPVSKTVYSLVKAIESRYLTDEEISDDEVQMAVEELVESINSR